MSATCARSTCGAVVDMLRHFLSIHIWVPTMYNAVSAPNPAPGTYRQVPYIVH